MSISVLCQVYDEVRRLAIAGSGLAAGDFRLKKLVAPLVKSAEKAPVFGKVAQAISQLVDGPAHDAPAALLELSLLTTAILYTQGETGAQGELQPLETSEFPLSTANTSARVLKPLIEALTTTGSGRLDIIRDAHERGAFQDLRLLKPTIAAIADPYPEIGEFVADNILPQYGNGIYEEIRAGFEMKGKGDDARRLKVLHTIDPETTRRVVEQALEEGSKDVRLEAIKCLRGFRTAIPFLLGQVKTRAQEVRQAALRSLATFPDQEVVDALCKSLVGEDLATVAEVVGRNPSARLQQFVLDELNRLQAELLSGKSKDKAETQKNGQSFYYLLQALAERKDAGAIAFLDQAFAEREKFTKIPAGTFDGGEINRRIAASMLSSGVPQLLKRLADAVEQLEGASFEIGFFAAAKSQTPAEIYDRFVPLYGVAVKGRKKSAKESKERAEIIAASLRRSNQFDSRYRYGDRFGDHDLIAATYENLTFDPRWLDAAIEREDTATVLALSRGGHPRLNRLFANFVQAELDKKKWDPAQELYNILEKLIEFQDPQATALLCNVLAKSATGSSWNVQRFARLVPKLPLTSAPEIEALIPQFDAKTVDYLALALDELNQQAAKA